MEMADGDRLTPEQAEALSALRDGRNVFLSGNAGTGKSYVLNAFISDLKARNVDFLALAPTGIAALNLTDGSTIHRTLKIAPGVCAPDGPKGSRKVLDAAKVIIIDEISKRRPSHTIALGVLSPHFRSVSTAMGTTLASNLLHPPTCRTSLPLGIARHARDTPAVSHP